MAQFFNEGYAPHGDGFPGHEFDPRQCGPYPQRFGPKQGFGPSPTFGPMNCFPFEIGFGPRQFPPGFGGHMNFGPLQFGPPCQHFGPPRSFHGGLGPMNCGSFGNGFDPTQRGPFGNKFDSKHFGPTNHECDADKNTFGQTGPSEAAFKQKQFTASDESSRFLDPRQYNAGPMHWGFPFPGFGSTNHGLFDGNFRKTQSTVPEQTSGPNVPEHGSVPNGQRFSPNGINSYNRNSFEKPSGPFCNKFMRRNWTGQVYHYDNVLSREELISIIEALVFDDQQTSTSADEGNKQERVQPPSAPENDKDKEKKI